MPRFILEIELGNDAMCTGFDVTNALSRIVKTIEGYSLVELTSRGITPIRDINGNTVGHYEVRA